MTTRQQIIALLSAQAPGLRYTESNIWDVLEASRGLTIVMLDGTVCPLRCGQGVALRLLYSWAVESRAN